jgi:hypothetical protein
MNVEAAADQAVDNMLDLSVRGAFLHHNDHECFPFPSITALKRKMAA